MDHAEGKSGKAITRIRDKIILLGYIHFYMGKFSNRTFVLRWATTMAFILVFFENVSQCIKKNTKYNGDTIPNKLLVSCMMMIKVFKRQVKMWVTGDGSTQATKVTWDMILYVTQKQKIYIKNCVWLKEYRPFLAYSLFCQKRLPLQCILTACWIWRRKNI